MMNEQTFDYLKALEEAQKEYAVEREKLEYPFSKVQIDQESGKFRIIKDGTEIAKLDTIEFVVIDRWNEYYKYDSKINRKTITSTIERNPSACKDRRTGALMSTMKNDDDIVFQIHLISVLLNYEVRQVDIQFHGTAAASFIALASESKQYSMNSRFTTKIKATLEEARNKKVVYYRPVFEIERLTSQEDAKLVFENIKPMIETYEKFVKEYNSRYTTDDAKIELINDELPLPFISKDGK